MYFPGMIIGELSIILFKGIGSIFNYIINFFNDFLPIKSPYVRGFTDIVFEGLVLTFLGRAVGMYIIIYVPIIIFKRFTKIKINWTPCIILLVPFILWFGGIRQIEKYIELYEGLKLLAISLGFILGTFVPLFYAYLYSKDKVDIYWNYK
tara:strand:- start:2613 stop:3062 length:450 start_codon:yes stop_codon:yes gene_type:complete